MVFQNVFPTTARPSGPFLISDHSECQGPTLRVTYGCFTLVLVLANPMGKIECNNTLSRLGVLKLSLTLDSSFSSRGLGPSVWLRPQRAWAVTVRPAAQVPRRGGTSRPGSWGWCDWRAVLLPLLAAPRWGLASFRGRTARLYMFILPGAARASVSF